MGSGLLGSNSLIWIATEAGQALSQEPEYKSEIPIEVKPGQTLVLEISAKPDRSDLQEPSVVLEFVDEGRVSLSDADLSVALVGNDGTEFRASSKDGEIKFYQDIPPGIYSVRFDQADSSA